MQIAARWADAKSLGLAVTELRLKYQHSWLPHASVSPRLEDVLSDGTLAECLHGTVTVYLSPAWCPYRRQHPIKEGPFSPIPHLNLIPLR